MLKLYDFALSPSPRRVRVFAAEKGIPLELISVNVREMAQFSDSFRAISPNCTVPVLELEDGRRLCDSLAIWRYLEEVHPEPPLLGTDAFDRGIVEEWIRRIELEGYQAVVEALRNGVERFRDRAVPGTVPFAQIPELAARGRKRTALFMEMLDRRLRDSEFVAGPRFTGADIHALVTIDFAAAACQIATPDTLAALKTWHARVSARPSAKA